MKFVALIVLAMFIVGCSSEKPATEEKKADSTEVVQDSTAPADTAAKE
jgi:PBP1b-binding outer membrane lipoprotein LpoB